MSVIDKIKSMFSGGSNATDDHSGHDHNGHDHNGHDHSHEPAPAEPAAEPASDATEDTRA
jgi:hypothetical protein